VLREQRLHYGYVWTALDSNVSMVAATKSRKTSHGRYPQLSPPHYTNSEFPRWPCVLATGESTAR